MTTRGRKIDLLVYSDPMHYASFPEVIRTEEEIVLLFQVQPLEQLKAAKIHPHYQKFARPYWAISRDGGRTWRATDQRPTFGSVRDTTYASAPINGGMVTLTFSTTAPRYALIQHGSAAYRPYLSLEFSEAERHEYTDLGPFSAFFPHCIVRTGDGALLAGGYGGFPGPDCPQRTTAIFLRSEDEGRTWRYLSHMPNPNPFGFSEPAILPGPDGRVLCVLRTDWNREMPKDKLPADAGVNEKMLGYYLYQSESADGGRTWPTPRQLPLWGHPPCLKRLANGKVLLVFGVRRKPFGVQAVLSHDDGRTWDLATRRQVYTFEPGGYDLGYPMATQLDDGTILCAYYGYSSDDVKWSETPHGIFVSLFDVEWLINPDKGTVE